MGPRQMLFFHAALAAALASTSALEEENRQLARRVEHLEEQVRTLIAALHPPAPAAPHLAEVTARQPATAEAKPHDGARQVPKQRTALSHVLSERAHSEPAETAKKTKVASSAYSDDPEHAFFSMGEFSTACLRKVDVVCEMTYSGMQLWNKCHSPQAEGCKALLKDSALLWVAGDPVRNAEEMEKAQNKGEISEPTSGTGIAALSVVLAAREL